MYLGTRGDSIIRSTKRKLRHCFKTEINVKFMQTYKTTKLQYFTSTKDRIPQLSQSSVIYKITCPGCKASYIGSTECTLFKRTAQHAWESKDSAVYNHIAHCETYHQSERESSYYNVEDIMQVRKKTVRDNTKVLTKACNPFQLGFLESLYIKEHKPELNVGVKAAKSLSLF